MLNIRSFPNFLGVVFVVLGVAGFVPALLSEGKLFGLFEVSTMYSSVYLISGILAFLAIYKGQAKLYLRIFGVIYAIMAVLGFIKGGDLFFMHVNMADTLLNFVIAVGALYVGYWADKKAAA